jgi:hypothetical protein
MLLETKKIEKINKIISNDNKLMTLNRVDSQTIRHHLSNISDTIRMIVILDSEFADFSEIDLCGLPNLQFVNLKNTDSNFEEQGYECAKEIVKGLYEMDYEKPKELGFSEPTSSTNSYGKYNYSFK